MTETCICGHFKEDHFDHDQDCYEYVFGYEGSFCACSKYTKSFETMIQEINDRN